MLRLLFLAIVVTEYVQAQGCDPDPCLNGRCSTEDMKKGGVLKCICQDKWTGMRCDIPRPEVICGNKSIDIFIDKRIVTEKRLPEQPSHVQFLHNPECTATEKSGSYHLKVSAPFNDCGVTLTRDGDDYALYQKVVWNSFTSDVERPLVLLDFKCAYTDTYIVSLGGIRRFKSVASFETGYGTFTIDMALYKEPSFKEESRLGSRPVVTVQDEVCVSTELQDVMPKDFVLTNRKCWASTREDGSGELHPLVSAKCEDDPATSMLSNGESDFARFCFQMFKWKNSLEKIFVNCVVNVCNASLDVDHCRCAGVRGRRFARSIPSEKGDTRITFGPVYVVPAGWDKNQGEEEVLRISNNTFVDGEAGKYKDDGVNSKRIVLTTVVAVLVFALILLIVAVAVYINYIRAREPKSRMRNDGESVVIPTPLADDAMLN